MKRMFFLQVTPADAGPSTGTIWLANVIGGFITSTFVVTLFWFLLKGWLSELKRRLVKAEEDAAAAHKRADNIEKNYVQRFRDTNEHIHDVKDEIVNRFDHVVQKINDEKNEYRQSQSRWMGQIETKIDNVAARLNDRNGPGPR